MCNSCAAEADLGLTYNTPFLTPNNNQYLEKWPNSLSQTAFNTPSFSDWAPVLYPKALTSSAPVDHFTFFSKHFITKNVTVLKNYILIGITTNR